ncbi:MAG: 5-formyltetrahydrofolate cyclo-ligase [Cyanobacteria bacterium P01_E01_bin.34]
MTTQLDPPDYSSKADCRRYYKYVRGSLKRGQLSQQLCERLERWPTLQAARTILAYWAMADEIDLISLMNHWPEKNWGLPRTLPQRRMAWHLYHPGDALYRSKWGVLEPESHRPAIPLESIDIVLVPAIACDRQGTRLGYGGGFYDRCLAAPQLRGALTVGIIPHACWSAAVLPRDPWDVRLGAIATEREIWLQDQ